MTDFYLGPTDRVLVVGQTGTGKSTLARALTVGYRSQVVIDPKHEEELPRSHTVYTPAAFAQLYPHRATRIVFRPDPELADGSDVDAVMRRVLSYGHTALIVHEAMLYASATTIVPAYRRALIAGRTLQVPVWSCSQRPTGLHNVVISETTHVFMFDLMLEADRAKLAGIAGPGALVRPAVPFGFGYYGPRTNGLVRCSPLEVAGDPSDSRQPGDRDPDGDGGHLRRQVGQPNRSRPRSQRPRSRDLAKPPRAS